MTLEGEDVRIMIRFAKGFEYDPLTHRMVKGLRAEAVAPVRMAKLTALGIIGTLPSGRVGVRDSALLEDFKAINVMAALVV